MGGFADPIVGGGDQLVRNAIQSQNYVAGVSGWRIAKDGSFEANNGTFRGAVVVGPTTGAHGTVGQAVPTVVQNYYNSFYGFIQTTQFSILLYIDPTHYYYMIVGTGTLNGVAEVFAQGWVIGANIYETDHFEIDASANITNYQAVNGASHSSSYLFGAAGIGVPVGLFDIANCNMQIGNGVSDLGHFRSTVPANFDKTLIVTGQTTLNGDAVVNGVFFAQNVAELNAGVFVTGDLNQNGISTSRGVLDAARVDSTGALTAAASAETDIPNLTLTATLTLGRAYLVTVQVLMALSVATDIFDIKLRTGAAVTGTQIGDAVLPAGTNSVTVTFPVPPATSGALTFRVSFVRRTGTGTATPQGAAVAGQGRTWSMIQDLSSQSQWRST